MTTQPMSAHNPLPWNFDTEAYLKDANGKTICDFRYKNSVANTDLILSAVNGDQARTAPLMERIKVLEEALNKADRKLLQAMELVNADFKIGALGLKLVSVANIVREALQTTAEGEV